MVPSEGTRIPISLYLCQDLLFSVCFLNNNRPHGYEVISHDFDLHFSND